MKFEFKSVPVPKAAKKRIPKDRQSADAFKVRRNKEVLGTVVTFTTKDGKEAWAFLKAGVLYGGCSSRQDAAEQLVAV